MANEGQQPIKLKQVYGCLCNNAPAGSVSTIQEAPRFDELIHNIYTVLDFFNSRMDAHSMNGEWSVEKVLQVIITNCRSWRGDGMKMFTQLCFTYEQENHPEFFIPYVWKQALSGCKFSFNPNMITLFPLDQTSENNDEEDGIEQHQHVDPNEPHAK